MTDREHRNAEVDATVAKIHAREPKVQQARARAEMAKRAMIAATLLLVTACLSLLIYLAGSANAAAEAVRDCTEPGGTCYQRSQKQTGAVVGQIITAQREAAAQGSVPARDNLALTRANAHSLSIVLGILDREYPEAAAAVRRELGEK